MRDADSYPETAVFITGQAKPAKEDAIAQVHGVFYLSLIIDTANNRILDAQCNSILPMTDRFVHSLVTGYDIVAQIGQMESQIRSRYFALTQRALLACLKDARSQYLNLNQRLKQQELPGREKNLPRKP